MYYDITKRCVLHYFLKEREKYGTPLLLPPAARGALFEKTAPLDPPQKLLIIDLTKVK
jgi:hypothetical protein